MTKCVLSQRCKLKHTQTHTQERLHRVFGGIKIIKVVNSFSRCVHVETHLPASGFSLSLSRAAPQSGAGQADGPPS